MFIVNKFTSVLFVHKIKNQFQINLTIPSINVMTRLIQNDKTDNLLMATQSIKYLIRFMVRRT